MKTAMQELIEYIETRYSVQVSGSIVIKAYELLLKEKKQIEQAYDAGSGYDLDWEAEQLYYKETYKK